MNKDCKKITKRYDRHKSPPNVYWPVHLLGEDVSSREDASTSWPSNSGLRGRNTYLTILELADHALFKMVRYIL
jgi:hypothetical protein